MFRAPIWITSATSATSATSRGSSSSVTIGSPVSSLASARIFEPFRAEPLERVRRRARLEGAAAQERGARGGDGARGLERLLAGLDRARPGDEPEEAVADPPSTDLDDRRHRA